MIFLQKRLLSLAVIFLLVSSSSFAGQAEYDDCILKHLKNAKLDIATLSIKQACTDLYRSQGFMSDTRRKYNECLLEHLPGIESIQAVISIKSACYNKYH